jgi:epoxyqueuosine reductase
MKASICRSAEAAGFVRARILNPGLEGRPLLVTALSYGNQSTSPETEAAPPKASYGYIVPFAQRNYYREAVRRLQALSKAFREKWGEKKAEFQIRCNSPIPEKPLAQACGIGVMGRNSLLITPEAGSLVIIAAMTLPQAWSADLPGDQALEWEPCAQCPERPPCVAACPTGALDPVRGLERQACIQWYASGHENETPPLVARHWGQTFYGCSSCVSSCIHNRGPIQGVETNEGRLPPWVDCEEIIAASDADLKTRFKGSALGMSWLTPQTFRRSAALVLNNTTFSG